MACWSAHGEDGAAGGARRARRSWGWPTGGEEESLPREEASGGGLAHGVLVMLHGDGELVCSAWLQGAREGGSARGFGVGRGEMVLDVWNAMGYVVPRSSNRSRGAWAVAMGDATDQGGFGVGMEG